MTLERRPWLGLASFTEAEAARFFGREDELAELLRRVQRKRLTVLFGQSGLGKTSLLQAGLATRALSAGLLAVRVRMDYAPDAPNPAEQVKQAILATTQGRARWTQAGVAVAGETLWEFLHHRNDQLLDDTGEQLRPLLVFDQFEELFTVAQSDTERQARAERFMTELADLVENRVPAALDACLEADDTAADAFDFNRDDYRVLISLREDYLAPLESLKARMPSITQNRLRLEPLRGAQAQQAARGPAPELIDEATAEAVLRFVAGAAPERPLAELSAEPSLLSLFLYELNEQRIARGEARIDAALLEGSQASILSDFYERSLADQPEGVRHFIEDRLLTDSGYRDNVSEERARQALASAGAAADTLEHLVDRRLLRVEDRGELRRVELTHDVLCPVVRASRASRHEREARDAAEARQQALAQAQSERLAAARASARRSRRLALGAGLLSLAAVGSGVYGWWNGQRAQRAEARTETLRQQSDSARAEAEMLLDYLVTDFFDELASVGQVTLLEPFVQRVLAYHERLPAALHTPQSERNQALGLAAQSRLARSRGELERGERAIQAARATLERLVATGDLSFDTRLALAAVQTASARSAWDQGRQDEARQLVAQALASLQPLAAADLPSESAQRLRLAHANALHADGLYKMRSPAIAEGLASLRAAMAIAADSGGGPGGSSLPATRRYVCAASTAVEAAEALGDLAEAVAVGTPALERARWWLQRQPASPQGAGCTAALFSEVGVSEAQRLRIGPALRLLDESAAQARRFSELDPNNLSAFHNLGVALTYRTETLYEAGRLQQALVQIREAQAVHDRAAKAQQSVINRWSAAHWWLFIAAEIEPANRLPAIAERMRHAGELINRRREMDDTACYDALPGGLLALATGRLDNANTPEFVSLMQTYRRLTALGTTYGTSDCRPPLAEIVMEAQARQRDWAGLLQSAGLLRAQFKGQPPQQFIDRPTTWAAYEALGLARLNDQARLAERLPALRAQFKLPDGGEMTGMWRLRQAQLALIEALARADEPQARAASLAQALAQIAAMPGEMRGARTVQLWRRWMEEVAR